MRRKLLDSVSMQELQGMRETGLTNREIAQRLDVSYETINRHLGRCPFRRNPIRVVEEITPAPAPEVTIGCLRVISTIATLQGEITRYTVNTETGVVAMEDGLMKGVLDRDTIGDAIRELEEVRRMLLAR